jgi:ubiquinone/menaquinone biosynthesis C-methylase UbiE
MGDPADAFRDFEHGGWQKAATRYGSGFGPVTSQAIDSLLNAVQAGPRQRLLDVGTGPGYAAAAAASRGCSVIGVDFSSEMIALARVQNPGLDFQEEDAENLSFSGDIFDSVVMNFGMLHLGQPERAIAEAYRVLKNGGRFAFTVWDAPHRTAGFGIVLNAIQTYGNMTVPIPPGPPFFRFSDRAESIRTLTSAGFQQVIVSEVPQIWRLRSGTELFDTMRTAAVRTAALLNLQTDEARAAIRSEIEKQAERFRTDDGIELPMPAVLVCAKKVCT